MNFKVFIICVELNNKRAIDKFESSLRQLGEWKIIVPGTYALKQDFSKTSDQLKSMLLSKITPDHKLFIMKSSVDASWVLTADIDQWLKLNL